MSDMRERGDINPNVRSVISYNTDSEFIPTFRFNGILLAESTPIGGRISGTSSVMEMEGWNWEDAVHTVDMGMHLNWPAMMTSTFDFATFTRKREANKDYSKQVKELGQHFNDAAAYGAAASKVSNLKMDAMQRLFDGTQTLFLHANGAKEIVESVKFAQDYGVKKIVVVAGSSTLMVADFLKDNNIGVIIPPTHRLPDSVDEDVYGPYKLPNQLFEAGLMVSIAHNGMLGHARNLPFFAGTAAAYGLDKEEALKMITSNTAKLLGIDDRVGTLEGGKDATLFVSEGDALDFRTNVLSHAFISGKEITLDNKQQELFNRFSTKYGHTK
jgi:imidazolonepropionase-like amidohydrolase